MNSHFLIFGFSQNSFEDKSKDVIEMETGEAYGIILNVVLK